MEVDEVAEEAVAEAEEKPVEAEEPVAAEEAAEVEAIEE